MAMESGQPVLRVRDLRVEFATRRGTLTAVDGISFDVFPGEALGIVGESGSGKTVTALSILRMVPEPGGRIAGGSIELNGKDVVAMREQDVARLRGREVAMIMQDPMTSLDPLFTVGDQVGETIRDENGSEGRGARVRRLLEMVRIPAPASRARNYPHQMSGGMRQRVVAAISLASTPALLLADEPTTALDVTVQLQFLDMLRTVQRDRNLALVLITHDLSVVARACDRVAVMYAGRIVETATTKDLFETPHHPYTQGLLASIPRLGEFGARLPTIEGQPPDLTAVPSGCAFRDRCPAAMDKCAEMPPLRTIGDRHSSLCWLPAEQAGETVEAFSTAAPEADA